MFTDVSPARPTPQRRDAVANRERILQSARELFGEFGLDATLNDIAHHAGVGVGTVYRQFRNRDEIVDALWDEYLERQEDVATRALEEPDPWMGFVRFMEDALAMMAADRGLWTILHSDASKDRQIETLQKRVGFAMPEVVKRAIAAGELRADLEPSDLSVLAVIIGSVADFADASRRDVWRRYLALLLDGLRARVPENDQLPVPALNAAELRLSMETWRPSKRRVPRRKPDPEDSEQALRRRSAPAPVTNGRPRRQR
jgi:AcrR family transcriptional regulator